MLGKLKSWLVNNLPGLNSLFAENITDSLKTSESEKLLDELSPEMYQQLVDAVENLPINQAEQQAIISSVDEKFESWQKAPNQANNSVLILSSPVTAVSSILSEALEEWAEQKKVSIRILPLTSRPTAIASIKTKLEHYLESLSTSNNSTKQQPEVIIIPNLSWCFLRSLEGLAGIEYLQSLLCQNPQNRFWVVGANQVGWTYLNVVFSLQAYFGEVVTLSEIEQKELQKWFDPVIGQFDITFDSPSIDKQILDGDKDNKEHYFDRLHSISQGVSLVAAQSFVKSIRYQEIDEAEETSDTRQLIAQLPKLPSLPALESEEQYLLYSLLLHSDLTLSALATSLGDEEFQVQARIQMLCRKGIVKQKEHTYSINPIYYPPLKQYLENNNFLIAQR
ncbi:hypothetical protein Xen7305DRAFT_00039680 [Xenococcus sp. PCC 7305]|uniref:hypothetical protein n=1 Tax=Xenococcus sp. PCC 7305 TaxID=102125 RepID=UPI0002ABEE1B|nr:hypothetical protein [Xenococcus sp. PCC 7305]ELS04240.1 hypothetical protein Xen7305DRAFT_00039680 [Xenococcus sp. PCC 7305]